MPSHSEGFSAVSEEFLHLETEFSTLLQLASALMGTLKRTLEKGPYRENKTRKEGRSPCSLSESAERRY